MSLLIVALIVLLVIGLLCWGISTAPVIDGRLKWVLQAIVVLIGVVYLLNRAGMVSG